MKRSLSRALFALTLIALAAGLLFLSQGGYLRPVESLVLRPMSGVQEWFSTRIAGIKDLLSNPSDVATLRVRISNLEAENAQLQQEIIALREQLAEYEILAALLEYARTQPESSYLAATVIGRDVSPFLRSIWIEAGSDNGIRRGMPVVTERGLAGRVVDVYATVSRVQLITDPSAAVSVSIRSQDARADGLMAALPNGDLEIDMIEQDAQINPGDLVLTSGLGGTFPADVPIGQIVSVTKRDYELFQKAAVEPRVLFDQLEIVLVITNFRPLPFTEPSP